jgi:hypothetical protein
LIEAQEKKTGLSTLNTGFHGRSSEMEPTDDKEDFILSILLLRTKGALNVLADINDACMGATCQDYQSFTTDTGNEVSFVHDFFLRGPGFGGV